MQFGIRTWFIAHYADGGKTVPLNADYAFRVLDVLGDSDFSEVEQHTGLRVGNRHFSLRHHRIK